MTDVHIRPYEPGMAGAWDDLVAAAANGTFMLTRRFLSYHGDRFADVSLVVEVGGRLAGVLPAAADPADPHRVVSHPGLSYGGLVRSRHLEGETLVAVIEAIMASFREGGFRSLRYKTVPHVYHRWPAGDDSYALFRVGARRYRCDLAAVIDLSAPVHRSDNRRRSLRRAEKAGVTLSRDAAHLDAYWQVLAERLADRHGARPAHTPAEMVRLMELFPDHIELVTALVGGSVVAGVVLFNSDRVAMAQYIGSDEEGRRASALDLVFDAVIGEAAARGQGWFNFGTSTEQEGRYLNDSLYRYKTSFGAGGVVQEHFEVELTA